MTPSVGRILTPQTVPGPVGSYALALEVPTGARLVLVSGQIPEQVNGDIPAEFGAQCRLVWDHVTACLAEASLTRDAIIKVTTYLTSREDADENGAIRREYLGTHRPALTVVVAQTLDARWLLELEVIAAG